VVLVAMTAVVALRLTSRGERRWTGVDFLCPFGGQQTLYSLLPGDGFLWRSTASCVITLIGMLPTTIAYRRASCGVLCPLGTLQRILGAGAAQREGRGGRGAGEAYGEGGGDAVVQGRMSFADVAAMTGILLADFGAERGVSGETPRRPMKDIKVSSGFTTEEVRTWVDDDQAE
jgi:hypothetical protein